MIPNEFSTSAMSSSLTVNELPMVATSIASSPSWPNMSSRRGHKTWLAYFSWEKWPPFRRRHFQMYFIKWKLFIFNENFTEICSLTHWGRDKMAAVFADDTFKRIFLNENVRVSMKISLKFVPKGSINNNPALVQIMAWRRSGDKPLSEPMMVSLLTHTCVTRPQWVKE